MYFRKLQLQNFGPFADFTVELKRGSIGICGRNGSGKTTILNAMYGLLTNDFGRFDGVKVDCIRNVAEEKAASFVYGEICHHEHVLQIKRNLRGKPLTELILDGGKPITDSNKARDAINETLGVDGTMLDLYAFKTQDRIYDFLSTTPAERAKAFAVLCRTEKCEEIWTALGEFLNQDSEINAEIVDNSDELLQQLSLLDEQLDGLQASIATETELLLNTKSEHTARELIRKQERCADLVPERDAQKAHLKAGTAALLKAEARLAELDVARDVANAAVSRVSARAEATQLALKTMERFKQRQKRVRAAEMERADLQAESKTHVPQEALDTTGLTLLRETRVLMRTQLEKAKAAVALFVTSGEVICPTCGTPVASLETYLQTQQDIVDEYPQRLEELNAEISQLVTHEKAQQAYAQWLVGYRARKKANESVLADLAADGVQPPEEDEEKLHAFLASVKTLKEAAVQAVAAYGESAKMVNRLIVEKQGSEKQLDVLEEKIKDNTVPEDKVALARTRLTEHTAASHNISRLQGERTGVTKQHEALESQLERLRVRLKRSKKLRRAARIVQAVREVMHRDELPQMVAQVNLSRMEGDINEGLGFFGDPFWIESDVNLTFIAHKPGQPPQAAGRLSTGQRVVVALAFWPAVASLWSQDLGMLALDEPTANLDEENRKFLSEALGVLTTRVRDKRQLIMVTHDHNLKSAFDQVIDLDLCSGR